MNSPLPWQASGAFGLELWGPWAKNDAIAGLVGGTPAVLTGRDPLGYASDVTTSWMSGTALEQVAAIPSFSAQGDPLLARAGLVLLAVALIAIGIYWIVKA